MLDKIILGNIFKIKYARLKKMPCQLQSSIGRFCVLNFPKITKLCNKKQIFFSILMFFSNRKLLLDGKSVLFIKYRSLEI